MQVGSGPVSRLAEVRERMLGNPSPALRVEAATVLGSELSSGKLTDTEREIALTIVAHLAKDVEREVRAALAECVKACPFLPAATARALAEDVEAVSLAFLQVSPVLSDDDLIAIVRQGSAKKQRAIARREKVAAPVSRALVDMGDKIVVVTLLENRGAEISEFALHRVMDRFPSDETIQSRLVERASLPLPVVDRLTRCAADALRKRLVERHGVAADIANDLATQASEGALVRRMAPNPSSADVAQLVQSLQSRGKLTPSLLLQALCTGKSGFFTAGLAALARIPVASIWKLLADPGQTSFQALYNKAGLPPDLFRAFRTAHEAVRLVRPVPGSGNADRVLRDPSAEQLLNSLLGEFELACPANLRHLLPSLRSTVGGEVGPDGGSGNDAAAPRA